MKWICLAFFLLLQSACGSHLHSIENREVLTSECNRPFNECNALDVTNLATPQKRQAGSNHARGLLSNTAKSSSDNTLEK